MPDTEADLVLIDEEAVQIAYRHHLGVPHDTSYAAIRAAIHAYLCAAQPTGWILGYHDDAGTLQIQWDGEICNRADIDAELAAARREEPHTAHCLLEIREVPGA